MLEQITEKIISATMLQELLEALEMRFKEDSLVTLEKESKKIGFKSKEELRDSLMERLVRLIEKPVSLKKYIQIYLFEKCRNKGEEFPDTDDKFERWIDEKEFLNIKEKIKMKKEAGKESKFNTLINLLLERIGMSLNSNLLKELNLPAYKAKRETMYILAFALNMHLRVVEELIMYALRQRAVLPREYMDSIYRWCLSSGVGYEIAKKLIDEYENNQLLKNIPKEKIDEFLSYKSGEIDANIPPDEWEDTLKYLDTTSNIIGVTESDDIKELDGFRIFLQKHRDAIINTKISTKARNEYLHLINQIKEVELSGIEVSTKNIETIANEIEKLTKKEAEKCDYVSMRRENGDKLMSKEVMQEIFLSEIDGRAKLGFTRDGIAGRVGRSVGREAKLLGKNDYEKRDKEKFYYEPSLAIDDMAYDINRDELIVQLKEHYGENLTINKEQDIIIQRYEDVVSIDEYEIHFDGLFWGGHRGIIEGKYGSSLDEKLFKEAKEYAEKIESYALQNTRIIWKIKLRFELNGENKELLLVGKLYMIDDQIKILYVEDKITRVSRGDLLLLKFFLYSNGYDNQYFIFKNNKITPNWNGFVSDTNAMLKRAYLPEVYIYNPFDLFLWICFLHDEPFRYFLCNWAQVINDKKNSKKHQ